MFNDVKDIRIAVVDKDLREMSVLKVLKNVSLMQVLLCEFYVTKNFKKKASTFILGSRINKR